MIKIRQSIFETNSSSTHALSVCTAESYAKWAEGKLYWGGGEDGKDLELYTEEEVFDIVRKNWDKYDWCSGFDRNDPDELRESAYNYGYYTYDTYWNEYLEEFEERFTTKGGEKLVAFGQYGYC